MDKSKEMLQSICKIYESCWTGDRLSKQFSTKPPKRIFDAKKFVKLMDQIMISEVIPFLEKEEKNSGTDEK